MSSSADITVYIRDQNDNPPVFRENVYRADLTENATAGTKVIQVGYFYCQFFCRLFTYFLAKCPIKYFDRGRNVSLKIPIIILVILPSCS
jgi:hypothetical protein